MSRQAKNSKRLALARRFSVQRKNGVRTHNALSRRRLEDPKKTAQSNLSKGG